MSDVLGQRDALGQFLDALAPTINAVGEQQARQQQAQQRAVQNKRQQQQLQLAQQKEERLQDSADFDDTVKILKHFDNPVNALNVAQNIATDVNSSSGERRAATTMAKGFQGQVAGNTVFEDILDNGSLAEIADVANDLNIPKSQRDAAKTTFSNKISLNREIRTMQGRSQKQQEKTQKGQFLLQGLADDTFDKKDTAKIRKLVKTGNIDAAFRIATRADSENALLQILGQLTGQGQGATTGQQPTAAGRKGSVGGRAGTFNDDAGTFTFDDDPDNPILVEQ